MASMRNNTAPADSISTQTIGASVAAATPSANLRMVDPLIPSPVISDIMFARQSTSSCPNYDLQPSELSLTQQHSEEDRTHNANQLVSSSVASSIRCVPGRLLCGVCGELMVGHVYFCPNKHNQLCAACCQDRKPCPQCGFIVVPSDGTPRNYTLEELISKIEITRVKDTKQTNQQRAPNSTSRAPAKRNLPSCLLCQVCHQLMDGHIYFCHNKHSLLCTECCKELKPCPICQGLTIVHNETPRNFALEDQIRQMKENYPDLAQSRKLACDNEAAGCKFRLMPSVIHAHGDEHLFRMVRCPITSGCAWEGRNNKLSDHMRSKHPQNCRMTLGSETVLHSLDRDLSHLHVIRLGVYNFLLHVDVDVAGRRVSWAVALIGTGHAARSWTYQVQIYNKHEPRRKVTLTDICVSDAVPVSQICGSEMPLTHALSYLNAEKKLFFKVNITKK